VYPAPPPPNSLWYGVELGKGDLPRWAARTTSFFDEMLHIAKYIPYIPEPP
jgi:hypothetical protein